jgi:glycosyltransferase involved in cell wall biosynthesis
MIKVVFCVFNAFTHDSRVLKEAISIHNLGYDITVVAHGNKNLDKNDIINNIKIKRFSYFDRTVSKTKFAKLAIYLSYVFQVLKFSKNSNVMHCHDLNTLPIGVITKIFLNRKVKIVYDAHEYETEVGGLRGVRKKLLKIFERILIYYADQVITVSDAIAEEYAKLYKIKKPALVLNTPEYVEVNKKDKFRETFNISKNQIIFLYQGGFSKERGIELLLETFSKIEVDKVIVFMGYGPLEPLVKEYAHRYKNIYYHEAVKPAVLLEYTCSADIGILFYENSCLNHYYCSPNKMFEYLMAELPVIVSNLYEMKRLVKEYSIGIAAQDNSPKALQEAIEKITTLDRDQLIENIKRVKKIYNWKKQEKVLQKVYEDMLI